MFSSKRSIIKFINYVAKSAQYNAGDPGVKSYFAPVKDDLRPLRAPFCARCGSSATAPAAVASATTPSQPARQNAAAEDGAARHADEYAGEQGAFKWLRAAGSRP